MQFGKDISWLNLIFKLLFILIMILIAINALFPIAYMILTALKTRSEYLVNVWGLPIQPTLENIYLAFFEFDFFRLFLNSAIVTTVSTLIGTTIGGLAAFAFAKMDFAGRSFLLNFYIGLMSVPIIVMIVPLYSFMNNLGLVNTYYSMFIIYSAILIPPSTYLLTNFFKRLPNDLFSAAIIDGCTCFQTLYIIVLPLEKTAIITVLIINALYVYNDLLIPLIFVQGEALRTLMVGIVSFQGRFDVNVPLIMSGLFIAAAPLILIYFFAQRYIVQGFVEGALKE